MIGAVLCLIGYCTVGANEPRPPRRSSSFITSKGGISETRLSIEVAIYL
jgi:hypothetical protein